ncbi:MAG: Rrf2 family transcriptional regulator [Chitinophagaceae bacterium]
MLNSRFAIEVHILSLLAVCQEPITSGFIANSINCNPVLVRKELSVLNNAGLVVAQEGKNGGVRLAQNPSNIYLDELFSLVYQDGVLMSSNKNAPNPDCVIGRNINTLMGNINAGVKATLLKTLHRTSIADLVKGIN